VGVNLAAVVFFVDKFGSGKGSFGKGSGGKVVVGGEAVEKFGQMKKKKRFTPRSQFHLGIERNGSGETRIAFEKIDSFLIDKKIKAKKSAVFFGDKNFFGESFGNVFDLSSNCGGRK